MSRKYFSWEEWVDSGLLSTSTVEALVNLEGEPHQFQLNSVSAHNRFVILSDEYHGGLVLLADNESGTLYFEEDELWSELLFLGAEQAAKKGGAHGCV